MFYDKRKNISLEVMEQGMSFYDVIWNESI